MQIIQEYGYGGLFLPLSAFDKVLIAHYNVLSRTFCIEIMVWVDMNCSRITASLIIASLLVLLSGCSAVLDDAGIAKLQQRTLENAAGHEEKENANAELFDEDLVTSGTGHSSNEYEKNSEGNEDGSEFEYSEGAYDHILFRRGTIQDNKYINESLGIEFAPSEEWRFFTEEEQARRNGMSMPLQDEEVESNLASDLAFIDLIASHKRTTVSVTVYQPKEIDGLNIMKDEEMIQRTYRTALDETSPENLRLQLEKSGVSNVSVTQVDTQVLGENRPALRYTYFRDEDQYVGEKVLLMKGGYMFEAAAISDSEEDVLGALSHFSWTD